jgi:hypothetical protein
MNDQCPSNFARDAFRLGFDDTLARHVENCPRCTAWLDEQTRLEAQLAGLWGLADAKGGARKPNRSRWPRLRYLVGVGLPVAAIAAVLFLLVLPKPPVELAKGSSAPVQIARLSHGALAWLSTEDTLLPNDKLRFFVRARDPDDRFVLVGSVDASERLSRFYPEQANGCSVALPARGEALGGSIIIDDVHGPERMVVVLSHRPLCWPEVGELVRRFGLGEAPMGGLVADDVHVVRLVFAKRAGTGL